MSVDVTRLGALLPTATPAAAEAAVPGAGAAGFGPLVGRLVSEVNQSQIHAQESVRALAEGRGDLVDAVLSLNRAELSLGFLVGVRDRALEAYQEIMRLQV